MFQVLDILFQFRKVSLILKVGKTGLSYSNHHLIELNLQCLLCNVYVTYFSVIIKISASHRDADIWGCQLKCSSPTLLWARPAIYIRLLASRFQQCPSNNNTKVPRVCLRVCCLCGCVCVCVCVYVGGGCVCFCVCHVRREGLPLLCHLGQKQVRVTRYLRGK